MTQRLVPQTYTVVVTAQHMQRHIYEVQATDESLAESHALDQFNTDYPEAEVDDVTVEGEGDV